MNDTTLSMGCGYNYSHGETPNKSIGTDAKDTTIDGYNAFMDLKNKSQGANFNLQQQNDNSEIGYASYTILQKLYTTTYTSGAFTKISPLVTLNVCADIITLRQDIDFNFWGKSRLFQAKQADASQVTLQLGRKIDTPNNSFVHSMEVGPIINTGSVIPGIIEADIDTDASAIGGYARVTWANGLITGIRFSRYNASGVDSYFSLQDLREEKSTHEIDFDVTSPNKRSTITAGYIWGDTRTTFLKATPIDFLLAGFPEGASRQSHYDTWAVNGDINYAFNPFQYVGIKGIYSEDNIDQYGFKMDNVPRQKMAALKYTVIF